MELWLVVLASAIWVFIDAKSIGVRKDLVPGFWNLGAVGWAVATLLLWIVIFPAYLIMRGKLKAAAEAESDNSVSSAPQAAAPVAAEPAPAAPPSADRSTAADSEVIASLERLADLRDRGVLTGEEFEQKKMQLLAN